MDWIDRLREEKEELKDKFAKLDEFITSHSFTALSEANKIALTRQLYIMGEYLDILTVRLELAGEPV